MPEPTSACSSALPKSDSDFDDIDTDEKDYTQPMHEPNTEERLVEEVDKDEVIDEKKDENENLYTQAIIEELAKTKEHQSHLLPVPRAEKQSHPLANFLGNTPFISA